MNIVSPNFIDLNLDFNGRSFLNLDKIIPICGGVSPLLSIFDNINWIKPSLFNDLCEDDVVAYFIDVGDGVKRTAVNYRLCELSVDVDFAHVMYGDYFILQPAVGSILSVDFAGIADVNHIEKILSFSDVRFVFCSEHDLWADSSYLNSRSQNRVIIWHSPECVRLYFNNSIYVIPNDKFSPTKNIFVGAGDIFALCVMRELYKRNFEELTSANLIDSITNAMNFVSKRCFS